MQQAESYIYNTDFLKAIRKNKRNSVKLVLLLFLIMMTLGYLMGWFVELQSGMGNINSYNQYGAHYNYSYYSQNQNIPINMPFEISRFGLTAAFIALIISMLWSGMAVFFGRKLILSAANATELSHQDSDYPMLTNVVQEISIAAGITPPKTYIIETPELNAFATGMSPKSASIAITRGLLQQLNRDELQGVMAHEIGHVINYDIRYQTLVSIIVGLIVLLSDIAMRMTFYSSMGNHHRRSSSNNNGAALVGLILLVFSIIAPIAALMLQMAVSRQREYLADATSVKLTRNPLGLISALGKLGRGAKPFDGASKSNQNLFIVNPFRNVAKLKGSLLATHPPLEDRIERLKNLDK